MIKNKIKKIEDFLQRRKNQEKPSYAFSDVQIIDEPPTIDEIKNGQVIKKINSNSKEGKRIIKDGLIENLNASFILLPRKKENEM